MRFGCTLLIALACSSCSHAVKPPQVANRPVERVWYVWPDARFTYPEMAEVIEAVEDWNYALNGYIRFVIVPKRVTHPSHDYGVLANRIWSGNAIAIDRMKDSDIPKNVTDSRLAYVDAIGGGNVYLLVDRLRPMVWYSDIVEHELGHTMGLIHVDTHTIMSGVFDETARCIDRETLDQLAKLRGWNPKLLRSTCK